MSVLADAANYTINSLVLHGRVPEQRVRPYQLQQHKTSLTSMDPLDIHVERP